jgi:hypothetical protein
MFIAVILENFIEEEEDLSLAGITDKDLKRLPKSLVQIRPLWRTYYQCKIFA